MIGVYKFTNKFNRKVYVGKSVDIHTRYIRHKRDANKGVDNLLYRAIRKYGIENFDFDVLIECPKENLDYWEKFYIRYYCSNNPNFGYNLTKGGDGVTEWTQKMKDHNAELSKKLWENKEYRTKCTNSHKNKPSNMAGKNLRDESKEKIKQSLLIYYKTHNSPMKGKPYKLKGSHRVYEDETHTKYHYEF